MNPIRSLAAAALLVVAACSGDGAGAVPVASITVESTAPQVLPGRTVQLTAILRDANGNALGSRPVEWASQAPGLATVNGSGQVTGIAGGAATITATSGSASGQIVLTVLSPPVASVVLSPDSLTLAPRGGRVLVAVLRDADGYLLSGRAVQWTTSSAAVATVDAGGTVTAVAEGTANVYATSEGRQSAPAVVRVRVPPAPIASLAIQPAAFRMAAGEARAFTVVARSAGGQLLTGRTVTVTSSAPGVATVTADSVRGVSAGTATITAQAEGITATAQVEVLPSATRVSGIIATNTTWTRAASPYLLTDTVQVAYGATLTLEPGVTVLGAGMALEVWGTLAAVGTDADPVRFDATHVVGRGAQDKPYFLRLERAVVDRGSVQKATSHGVYGSMVLRHSLLRDTEWPVYLWYPTSDVFIEYNRFVRAGGVSVGARLSDARVYVRGNAFAGSGMAVLNWASYGGEVMVVERNSFLSSGQSVMLGKGYGDARLSAPNNYWGTTDEAVIQSKIYDANDDLEAVGTIPFRPFLTAPDPATPAP